MLNVLDDLDGVNVKYCRLRATRLSQTAECAVLMHAVTLHSSRGAVS